MNTKTRPSFSIDKKLYEEFIKVAKLNHLNKSSWMEDKIRKYVEKNNKNLECKNEKI